mmetsp:Transcript_320/g.564  ORF Transcript_320/g.564 Transcript_320/m.564 type:complete len:221 (-) Transcript_320:164-826(-)|eukprot:CAMPEP_0201509248 /NCGR_PEP_ID=MMETSP0161_2-20130828/2364_1 /ASSEMBLY_ACC=CAM_ASM_000251 /TAXON_ID=180227 /ORGANISM="Neoparamoeba aestuarina, Strain SoJaBio B1-5/56/2" /LENGTH=220 /DNA_ID=CAMNT_0047904151 /DNA_START=46 /DNA_END=708 /DNA_ORIENTATION=+
MGNVAVKNKRRRDEQSPLYIPTSVDHSKPKGKYRPPPALDNASFKAVGLGTCPFDFNGWDWAGSEQSFRMYDRMVTFEMDTPQRDEEGAPKFSLIDEVWYDFPSDNELKEMMEYKEFCFVCFDPYSVESGKRAEELLTRITNLLSGPALMAVGNVMEREGKAKAHPNIGKNVVEDLGIRYIEVNEKSNHYSKFSDALYLLAGIHLCDDGMGGLTVKRARH